MNETFWLEPLVAASLLRAYETHRPDAATIEAFERTFEPGKTSRIMTVSGKAAGIRVEGTLTSRPNWYARYYGGGNTTYREIMDALAEADANPDVREAVFLMDSGGGQFGGLFELLAAIKQFSKPLRTVIGGMGASAAYAIAAATNSIEATNKATLTGSVGVAATFFVSPYEVTVTSTDAPNKRPDPKTDEGKAAIRKELDALHEIFVAEIAAGRKVSVDKVNADFGQGGLLVAEAALKQGMIDTVSAAPSRRNAKVSAEAKPMTLDELKAQHPEVYAAAVKLGTDSERTRVKAFVKMGETFSAVPLALKSIEEGREMDALVQAEFFAEGKKADSLKERKDEAAEAGTGDPSKKKTEATDLGDQIMAAWKGREEN